MYGKELFSVYPERRPLGRRSPGAGASPRGPGPQQPGGALSGKYTEAEPLYKRALAIREKTLPGRDDEAVKLEARARAIRAKHAR